MRFRWLGVAALVVANSAPAEVMRSHGYGLIIADGKLYHEAGRTCWPDPDVEDAMAPYARTVRWSDGLIGRTAAEDGETVYPFQRIARIPETCLKADRSDRTAVLAMADLMVRYYPGAGVRGIDLAARRAALARRLGPRPTSAQAWDAALTFLDGITDAHLELAGTIGGREVERTSSEGRILDAVHARGGDRPERAWLHAWRDGIERDILGGSGHVAANSRVLWGKRGDVGYLAIVTMGGFDPDDSETTAPLADALDRAMREFAGVKAVVVDVSNNRGGYDSVSRRIASRFSDRSRLAMTKAPFGAKAEPQPLRIVPTARPSYRGPVYVLTSDVTVSAGEIFTQMMRVLPQVVQVGMTTRGAFSDQAAIPLPNGWHFAMPMEVYRAPDGRVLEGRGLVPKVKLDLYPARDLDHGHAKAVVDFIDRRNGSPTTRR